MDVLVREPIVDASKMAVNAGAARRWRGRPAGCWPEVVNHPEAGSAMIFLLEQTTSGRRLRPHPALSHPEAGRERVRISHLALAYPEAGRERVRITHVEFAHLEAGQERERITHLIIAIALPTKPEHRDESE